MSVNLYLTGNGSAAYGNLSPFCGSTLNVFLSSFGRMAIFMNGSRNIMDWQIVKLLFLIICLTL